VLKRLEKGVLDQVLGEGKVAQQTHTDPIHDLLIPLNERAEGGGISLQGTSYQLRVAEVRHVGLTAAVGHASPCGVRTPAGRDDRFLIMALCSCVGIASPPVNTQWPRPLRVAC
jgi:hypothetical protein